MDTYLKMIGIAIVGILLCLILSKSAKDYCFIISLVLCCALCAVTVNFIKPIFDLLEKLEIMIGKTAPWLSILTKAVGLSLIGETVSAICADAGHGAVGKMIQLCTAVVIMFVSLPLIQNLLDMIMSILEML